MSLRRPSALALSALLAFPAVAAEPPAASVSSRVDVVVRTLAVVVTDKQGRPLETPPALSDIEIREDGKSVEIVGIEPGGGPPPPVAPAVGASPASSPAPAAAAQAAPARTARRVKQVLYVDNTFLREKSVREASAAVQKILPSILRAGPLEIVVADPAPRVFMAATGDEKAAREGLEKLAREISGRNRIQQLRRQVADFNQNDPRRQSGFRASTSGYTPSGNQLQRSLVAEEATLLRDGMSRLARWATSATLPEGGTVYLASDGFDLDQTQFYTDTVATTVWNEQSPMIFRELDRARDSLLAGGWTVVPIALNAAADATSTSSAEFTGHDHYYAVMETGSSLLSQHPLDPLRDWADATGGEIVVDAKQLPGAASRLTGRWLVSWRVVSPIDGRLHPVQVKSRREDLYVRAAAAVPVGTPESTATSRLLDVLDGSTRDGGLPVVGVLGPRQEKPKGRTGATLTVKTSFAGIQELLARVGPATVRISIAVDVPGKQPFVWHQTRAVGKAGISAWSYEAPIEWPKDAKRIAIVVEELGTGSWGSSLGPLTNG